MTTPRARTSQKAEQLSLPITLLILVIAFGGLLIAGIPVLLAMSAVFSALGLTAVASQLLPVTDVTQSVILLIGLAVGVDYSIFYIARERQERARGVNRIDAIEIAAATSGRAVLVSGLTVMAAMSGMFLAGNGVFSGIALATILVVATAIIGSLTVLPAMLAPKTPGFLRYIPGSRVMGRGFRFVGRGIAAAWAFVTWPFRKLQSLLLPRPRRDHGLAAHPAAGAQAPGHLGHRLGLDPGRPGDPGRRPQARPRARGLRHVRRACP